MNTSSCNLQGSPLRVGGQELYNVLSPYPTEITNQISFGICPLVFERCKRTTRKGRRTTDNDGLQPIELCHLSDSCDLIKASDRIDNISDHMHVDVFSST